MDTDFNSIYSKQTGTAVNYIGNSICCILLSRLLLYLVNYVYCDSYTERLTVGCYLFNVAVYILSSDKFDNWLKMLSFRYSYPGL